MIETKKIEGKCRCCSCCFPVEESSFICPWCQSGEITVVGGNEFYIDYIEGE